MGFTDNNYPINSNPSLKNGLFLSDVYNIFRTYKLEPLSPINRILSVEFALLIGFTDDKEQVHFENGLKFLKKDLFDIVESE